VRRNVAAEAKIVVLSGYDTKSYSGGKHMAKRRKRRGGGKTAEQRRFTAAAHSCKVIAHKSGRKGAYHACMKAKLKK
jgi:hypothetical protein